MQACTEVPGREALVQEQPLQSAPAFQDTCNLQGCCKVEWSQGPLCIEPWSMLRPWAWAAWAHVYMQFCSVATSHSVLVASAGITAIPAGNVCSPSNCCTRLHSKAS